MICLRCLFARWVRCLDLVIVEFEYEILLGVQQMKSRGAERYRDRGRIGVAEGLHMRAGVLIWR